MTTLTLTLLTLGAGMAPLQALSVKEPGARFKNLTVYPLFEPLGNANPSEYISLDEGLKTGSVVVTEKGGQGSAPLVRSRTANLRTQNTVSSGQGAEVNSLWITNKSGKKLILLAGEMVVGGQQDRIIQKDGLIPPGKKAVNLDVFCVEHGRWAPKTSQFSAPASAARSAPMGGIADPSVRGRAQAARDQGQVWAEVDRSLAKNKTTNSTKTYQENLRNPAVQGNVDQYVRGINATFPLSKAVGAVVSVNGQIVWMDRFANNATFRKYWPKLIRSYALEGTGSLDRPATKKAPATYDDALRYASNKGEGVTKFEGQEGVWKLLRTEGSTNVRFELQDVTSGQPVSLHASRMRKH